MNVRGLLVIGLALVCGLSAVFLVKALRNPIATPVIERTGVVYAIENVKTGEMVSEASVEIRQIPTADVPEDAIRKTSDAIDRAAKSTIDKGDMLRELKLAEKGAGRGMAALIRPGMRAFTIQTPTFSSSLAGFLLPGNRVDVLLTSTPIGNGTEATNVTTSTLLQDVEILAVHTNVSTPTANKINPDEARSVTLSVTPEDAQRLDLGQNKGTLHLTLRNPNDKSLDKADPATLLDLLGARPAPVVLEAPKPIQVVGLASKITPGMRAVTLDSTSFSSPLAGYLVADNRVDVVLTSNPMSKSSQTNGDVGSKGVTIASSTTTGANSYQANDDPSGGAATTTIVENIRILEMRAKSEVPNPAQDNAGDGRSITLEVSPWMRRSSIWLRALESFSYRFAVLGMIEKIWSNAKTVVRGEPCMSLVA